MHRLARLTDTIVAPITACGRGAIAVVRLSGPRAWSIAAEVFAPWPTRPTSHRAYFGRYSHGDEGLALCFAEGRGFTGEQAVEFSLHGSPVSVRALLGACEEQGARQAEPGEFTYRAFMNGRIDLTQAAGVRDSVEAATQVQLRHASILRQGDLRNEISAIRLDLEGVLAAIEASVDFGEEIGDLDVEDARRRLVAARAEIDRLLGNAAKGAILRDGLRIALVGLPNAGKSSLMNALLGFERAIVTPQPGTTRDAIEERCELDGVLCVLTDTAGLRETDDRAEALGVDRARAVAASADQVWYLVDSERGWTHDDDLLVQSLEGRVLRVATKIDLADAPPETDMGVSIVTGAGIAELVRRTAAVLAEVEGPIPSTRHRTSLAEALGATERATRSLEEDLLLDLTVVDLRVAIAALGEITGETASDDMVDRIFSDFCIGK